MGLKKVSKIICVVGPTATGKTKVSIELAKLFDGVIINADSTQVYKEPLIATAKIKESEKEGIEHKLFDIVSLNDDYTLYDYQKDARKLLDKCIKECRSVVIVGGSGLYIKALLYDYKLDETPRIEVDYSTYSNQELKDMADKIDKNNGIHINNRKRLERYITYYNQTGKKISKSNDINNRVYDFTLIGLKANREELYDRINKRVDEMFDEGLLDEATVLYKKHYKNFSYIIGYRELEKYFNKEISLEEAKELIKRNTRRYAKRQYTWFYNQMKDIKWFDVNYKDFNKTLDEIKKFLV